MRLKSLEISGFKSFADRTKLEFHPGVTGIVGPNGCGKSNVVDAIRWVLGETSAKALRGEEMADVIFNGTDTRKALGMAEVSLTLADCETALPVDYHEVCIGRRVYRDGKSEYLINRTPCRLRDILDLFAGTGIGRTCYSIMQQGKIDQLLSSKPEDRRQVFEEAAGITKFKQQKNEALRKLELTDANLLRITDVMEEQQRQMSSLQRQAAKARRYAALLHHVQVLDTHWSHWQYTGLLGERDQASGTLRTTRQQQQQIQEQLESLQSDLAQRRSALHELERQIRESLHSLSETSSRIDSAQKHVQFNEERRVEWQAAVARAEEEATSLRERLDQEKDRLSATGEELHRRSGLLLCQEEKLTEVLSSLSNQRRQRQEQENLLRRTQQRLTGCDASLASSRAQVESLSSQLRSQEERRFRLASDLNEIAALLHSKSTEKENLERNLDGSRAALEQRTEETARLESTQAAREEALRQTTGELHGRSRDLASQQARSDMLSQLAASGEGLENGTRQVLGGLDQPDHFRSSVQGTLVSFLQVEDAYFAATEAALGAAMQAVLVSDSAAAAAILERLRQRKLGSASLVTPFSTPPWAPSEAPEGSLGWLLNFIETAEPGKAALESLLQGIALAPDLDSALRLRQAHPTLPIATISGDFISASGMITGGFRDPQTGSALRIQREIRKLRKLTHELESVVAGLQERLRGEEEQHRSAQSELAKQREDLRAAQLQAAHLETQWKAAIRDFEQTEGRHQQLLAEQTSLDGQRETIQRQLAAQEEKLALLTAERDELARSLPDQEDDLRQRRLVEEETAEAAAQLRTEVAVEKQSAESLRLQLSPLNSRLQELERSLRQRRSESETHQQRMVAAAAESEQLHRQIAAGQAEIQSMRQTHDTLLQQREGLIGALDEMEATLASHRQAESQLTHQAAALDVRITQHELRLENLVSQISQRYQVDLQDFSPDASALLASTEEQRQAADRSSATSVLGSGSEPDWRLIEDFLPGMRRKLDSLGSVNLDAIVEFEELEQRFHLVRSQHEDLTKSRDELLKIIARINRTTRDLFSETFERIAANFRSMFAELFGRGSHANLVLLDEQDPLECGIDIIAKPPGKKLQSINLLSGGERSMTAVALLFAIYMVKPSPFCVLDELDAPLDEANIERFCRVLDRFCDQSQFIIVTHSKRTMHRADVMYGISMEERGVSKTLSVKLATIPEQATAA